MKRIISEELLNNIATYMDDEIREWCHDIALGKEPEEFLKQYYLRLAYEKGEDALDDFKKILYYEFNIDIYDIVDVREEEEALELYEGTDEYGTWREQEMRIEMDTVLGIVMGMIVFL